MSGARKASSGPVDEPDRGEGEDGRAIVLCRLRELRDRDAEKAVRGSLRDDARKDRRHLGRGLA